MVPDEKIVNFSNKKMLENLVITIILFYNDLSKLFFSISLFDATMNAVSPYDVIF